MKGLIDSPPREVDRSFKVAAIVVQSHIVCKVVNNVSRLASFLLVEIDGSNHVGRSQKSTIETVSPQCPNSFHVPKLCKASSQGFRQTQLAP